MDIKQITQFGPDRLGVSQNKGIPFYDSSTDAFIFILPPSIANQILSYDPLTKLYSWQNGDVTYTPSVDDTVSVPSDIGGIAEGTLASDLKGNTMSQMFDALLFPTILPTIGSPVAMYVSGVTDSGYREVGESFTFIMKGTLDRGTIVDGTGIVNNNPLVGPTTNFNFSGTSISTVDTTNDSLEVAANVLYGTNRWLIKITYSDGTGVYYDNKSIPSTILDMYREADVISKYSYSKTGIYPFFYGMSVTDLTTGGTALYSQLTKLTQSIGDKSVDFNGTSKFAYFAYPASYGNLSSIIDNNGFNVTGSFTKYTGNVISEGLGYNYTESYYIYKTTSLTSINGTFTFKF